MGTIIRTLRKILFPVNLETIFSEENKEKTALGIHGRITTLRMFDAEMKKLEQRVAKTSH